MNDNTSEIEKLTKTRNVMFLCALLVAGSTAMQLAGLFAVGAFPPWLSGLLVLWLIGAAIHASVKLAKLQQ